MKKSKIFADALKIISDETEIPSEKILSQSKEIDVVDARSILIHILYRKGIYPSEIAAFINKTKRCVNHSISTFESRLSAGKIMRFTLERVKKQAGID